MALKFKGESTWTKGLKKAPKGKPILVRTPEWDCPAVMRYETEGSQHGWGYVEKTLADIAGWLNDDEVKSAEWAHLPK